MGGGNFGRWVGSDAVVRVGPQGEITALRRGGRDTEPSLHHVRTRGGGGLREPGSEPHRELTRPLGISDPHLQKREKQKPVVDQMFT